MNYEDLDKKLKKNNYGSQIGHNLLLVTNNRQVLVLHAITELIISVLVRILII
jgi:hypothetical protein